MKNKYGQIKIQQMAFMLMAVTLFFVLVGMFLLVIRFSALKETASTLEEKNAMLLVTRLAESPEFSCGKAFGAKISCVDEDKVMNLKEQINNYENFWGIENIEIRVIYPKIEEKICGFDNYPNCNIIKLYDKEIKGFDASNFVSLCRKEKSDSEVYDKCELAKLMVSYKKVK